MRIPERGEVWLGDLPREQFTVVGEAVERWLGFH